MKIRYEATITGHEAPFKWSLFRDTGEGYNSKSTCGSGESDSYEDALFDAAEKARSVEWERRHSSATRKELLFEVDTQEYGDPHDC